MIKIDAVKKKCVATEYLLERWGNAVRDRHDFGLGAKSIFGVIRDMFAGGGIGLPLLPDDDIRDIQHAIRRLGEYEPSMRQVIELHYVRRISLAKLAKELGCSRDAMIEAHDAAVWWLAGDLSRGTLTA